LPARAKTAIACGKKDTVKSQVEIQGQSYKWTATPDGQARIDANDGRGTLFIKSNGKVMSRKRIEAASPCVCYFDEFDKFFMANNTSSEDSETKQILGVLLTWLQEKQSPTFVIATLNRLDALPPELTRAGRFDKIFYVGFPQAIERKQIFQLHGSKYDQRYKDDSALNYQQWQVLLGKTQNCTGAEIRAIVETAVKKCFHQGREILLELEELLAGS
jgi:SpoVK/Ycf46/Vps4 family AAA+-type ATPase